jgi:hypothetical protein
VDNKAQQREQLLPLPHLEELPPLPQLVVVVQQQLRNALVTSSRPPQLPLKEVQEDVVVLQVGPEQEQETMKKALPST